MKDKEAQSLVDYAALFAEENREAGVGYARTACIVAGVLFPVFGALDLVVYPHLFEKFMILRLVCTSALILIYLTTLTDRAKGWMKHIFFVIPIPPMLGILAMIRGTGDPGTPYFAGLILVLLGMGFILHWPLRPSIFVGITILAGYLAVTIPILGEGPWAFFVSNVFFLSSSCLFVILGAYVHHRVAYRGFVARKQLDANRMRLARSERLASLGQMSAGVIHEINNPLNFASSAVYLLNKKIKLLNPPERETFAEIVGDLKDGIDRVGTIVSDLRMFSHPETRHTESVGIAEVAGIAQRFTMKSATEEGVSVEANADAGLTVRGNENQLVQLFINLIQNGIHAIGDAGRKEGVISIRAARNGDTIEARVRDNGAGIPSAHVSRLFDPFFTTKDVGRGSGLGLSISHTIMEDHEGSIAVESALGEFTEFILTFPQPSNTQPDKAPTVGPVEAFPQPA